MNNMLTVAALCSTQQVCCCQDNARNGGAK